ncbi:hypothetical protein FAVG1_00323 [Fusarium avenaceum]|nr:hypothetical protein FAVG1_00323 [Fusarium avenaceum]
MASNSGNKSVGTQTPFSFGDDPARDLNREREEAERQGRENPASGNTSGNNGSQQQQQHQNGPEDHPIVGHAEAPRQRTFQAAFSFNRGRGQSQGQSRGITYNRVPWRGSQNYGRGQSENRGGPGRGNFAVTRYNRGGYSQNSRGGIIKSAKPVAVEKPAPTVVNDKQSREHAANASSGGGTQAADFIPPKVWTFVVRDMEHLEESVKLMQRHNPYQTVHTTLTAVPNNLTTVPDNLRQIARNRQLQQSTQYTDRKYPVKKGPKESPRVEHVADEEGVRCVSCGSKSHLIGFCLSIRDGELRGCPLCHDIGHLVDQCQTFLAMSLTNKVRTLVDGRARMPPLATTVPWWDYLHQWLEDDVSKNADPPSGFPWSVDFTKMVNQEDRGAFVKGRQQEFDKDHNKRSILPYDADTSKFQSIYRKYWSSEQKSFPERIMEMTGEVAPNDEFSGYKMQPIPPDFDVNAEPKGNDGF